MINFNYVLKFYTPSYQFVDSITNENASNYALDLSYEINKKGGLKTFTIKMQRDVAVNFFNQMLVECWINNNKWWTGLVDFNPINDSSDLVITMQGNGLIKQLEKQIINVTYTSKTILYIINDIFTVQIPSLTDILYDVTKIIPPTLTLATFEANDKSVNTVLDDLLDICNSDYSNVQYTYYIDKDRYLNLCLIDKTTIQENLFEGIDYQSPKVQVKTDKLKNKINIYKNNAVSQTVVYDSQVSNSDSIALYGEKMSKLTIPSNLDSTSAQKMANYIISRWKDPKKTITLQNVNINNTPYGNGIYSITNKQQNYTFVYDECSYLANWTYSVVTGTLSIENTIVNSGRKSFKWINGASSADYIEYTFTNPVYFWEYINIYIRPEDAHCSFLVTLWDKDSNEIVLDSNLVLTTEDEVEIWLENDVDDIAINEALILYPFSSILNILSDNSYIGLENDDLLGLENLDNFIIDGVATYSLPVVTGVFTKQIITNNFKSSNIKKIRFTNIGQNTTAYFDRLEVSGRLFSTSILTLESGKYKSTKNMILADLEFGEIEENAIDKISEITDKQLDIFNIFTKH